MQQTADTLEGRVAIEVKAFAMENRRLRPRLL